MTSKATFAGLADRSVAAYKAWITDVVTALGGEIEDDITDEEWATECAAFWRKADTSTTETVSLAEDVDLHDLRRRIDSLLTDE